MRWLWIDQFVEFVSGRRAAAVKNVTLGEEEVDEYLPYYPMFPSSVIVEGLAQTGGLLVAEHYQFRERVVLAKVGRAVFHRPVRPGDRLTYLAEAQEINPQGAIVKGQAHVGSEPVADVELVFAHLDDRFPSSLFDDRDLVRMLRLFRLYEVARDEQGQPLEFPPHLREAEAKLNRE
jgi:3-hydroxyacyl-[acyl-carrier-protein] dehydratase